MHTHQEQAERTTLMDATRALHEMLSRFEPDELCTEERDRLRELQRELTAVLALSQ